jgi:hypothetical protein
LTLHAIGVGGECFEGNLHGWGGESGRREFGERGADHTKTQRARRARS